VRSKWLLNLRAKINLKLPTHLLSKMNHLTVKKLIRSLKLMPRGLNRYWLKKVIVRGKTCNSRKTWQTHSRAVCSLMTVT
jgi:hypothetical protein